MNTSFNLKQRGLKLALVSAFALGSIGTSVNSYAADGTAAGSANVVTAISITKVDDLRFGNIAAGTTLGTVVMTSASGRSATGGVTLSSVNAGGAANFTVSGDTTATYVIGLPTAPVTITHTTDTLKTMTIDTFTSNPSGTGTLSGGNQTLLVGGTLKVAASQAAGSYTGNFSVSVNYQ